MLSLDFEQSVKPLCTHFIFMTNLGHPTDVKQNFSKEKIDHPKK